VTACTLAIALVPPFFAWIAGGVPAIVRHLAADSFIYLSVAVNSQAGFLTFDGVNPTNGFHPLWQVLLWAVVQGFGLAGDREAPLLLAFWLSAGLVAAGGTLIAQAVLRWSGSMLAAMLAFPGLFGMAMLFCGWPAGTMWSYVNGMESPASLLFFGLLLFYVSRQGAAPLLTAAAVDRRALLLLSLLSAGIVFSRLDDIFLPAIIGIWLLLRRDAPFARRFEAAAWFGLPLGAALLAYLAWNALSVGHAMPISATAKFDFRTPLINLGFLGSSLHAMVPDFLYNPFVDGDVAIADVNWRNVQMLGPVIAARLLLGKGRGLASGRPGTYPATMRLLLIYVMVKGLYNFLFVPLLHQGHWYFPLSIAIVNVALAVAAVQLCRKWAGRTPASGRLGVPIATAATAASLVLFIHGRLDDSINAHFYDLVRSGPRVAAALQAAVPAPRIVEADDGILNYALGLPTLSGFLFAIDPAGYKAYREGRFLAEASARGYQLIGSLYYLRNASAAELTPERIPDMLRARLFNATEWDLDKFDFALAYRDENTGAVFIRFTPKP
jgi:hypothetical protein